MRFIEGAFLTMFAFLFKRDALAKTELYFLKTHSSINLLSINELKSMVSIVLNISPLFFKKSMIKESLFLRYSVLRAVNFSFPSFTLKLENGLAINIILSGCSKR